MTEKRFKELCNDLLKCMVISNFEYDVDTLLKSGAIDLDSLNDYYRDIYPVVAAILEKYVRHCINGSAYEKERARAKKAMKQYMHFI